MQQVVAEISLGRIRKNAQLLVKKANTALYAVVKDDGYGHGAEQVAHIQISALTAKASASFPR